MLLRHAIARTARRCTASTAQILTLAQPARQPPTARRSAAMSTNAHDVDPGAPRTVPAGAKGHEDAAANGAAATATASAVQAVSRLQQGDRTRFLSRHYRVPLPTLAKSLSFDDANSWPQDPMQVFSQWYIDAEHEYNRLSPERMDGPVHWPNTMQISTVSPSGFPSVRTVLLKGYDERGLVFFTNYDGAKGQALRADPRVAIVFYWKNLERQVRVEGLAEMLTPAESDAYFHERPIQSQIGGVVSPQSRPIASHAELERAYVATVQGVAQQVQQHLDREAGPEAAAAAGSDAELAATKDRVSELLTKLSLKAQEQQQHPPTPTASSASASAADGSATLPAVAPLVAAPTPTPEEALATHQAHALALSSLQRLDTSPLTQPLLHSLVHRPPYWGGFLIRPLQVEFWCDGAYRLHSRIVYKQSARNDQTKTTEKKPTSQLAWTKTFLAP